MTDPDNISRPDFLSEGSLLALARRVAEGTKKAVDTIIGKEEADDFMFIGADGTDTKRIDLIAENEAIRLFEEFGHPMRIISEEIGEKIIGEDPEFSVILDPLDGTNNAVTGIPFYSISIAFAKPDLTDIFCGYIRNLANGDEFFAYEGKGALMNGEKIRSSSVSLIKELTISAYGYRHDKDRAGKICSRVRKIRILGSVALELSYVAAGKIDAFIDVRSALRLVDIAAGQLIVREAGGSVSDGFGCNLALPDNLVKPVNLVASNGVVHQDILDLISYDEIPCRSELYYYKGKVSKIAVVSRCDSKDALDMVRKIVDTFGDQVDVVLSSSPARLLGMDERGISVSKMEEEHVDLVISIGGDGTILRNIAKMKKPIPIIGIHMGTVGFLADVDPENAIDVISHLIRGFVYDERPRLELSVNGRFVQNSINEVVAISSLQAKIITFEIFVNGTLLNEVRADGIVFATPTGSTAYAMSAGGPIISPDVDAVEIVPLAPFKLSSRPWIIPFDNEITIRVKESKKTAVLVVDGKTVLSDASTEENPVDRHITGNDVVTIRRSRYPARFVRVSDAIFFDKVHRKLQ